MAITKDHEHYNGRVCNRCGVHKDKQSFRLVRSSSRILLKSTCKTCEAQAQKDRPKLSKEDRWKYTIKQIYGITVYDYYDMLESQNNKCKLCDTKEPGGKGRWHIDHCHDSGRVRGLLCHTCNTGIGLLQEDPELLCKAALYIKQEGNL